MVDVDVECGLVSRDRYCDRVEKRKRNDDGTGDRESPWWCERGPGEKEKAAWPLLLTSRIVPM